MEGHKQDACATLTRRRRRHRPTCSLHQNAGVILAGNAEPQLGNNDRKAKPGLPPSENSARLCGVPRIEVSFRRQRIGYGRLKKAILTDLKLTTVKLPLTNRFIFCLVW